LTCSYRFISEHRTTFAAALLCRILGVRRPGFYEWLTGKPARAARAAAEEQLATEIAEVHAEHRNAYGCPRVTVELRRRGRVVNHKRVERKAVAFASLPGGQPRCQPLRGASAASSSARSGPVGVVSLLSQDTAIT
jgi:HTH-like domain